MTKEEAIKYLQQMYPNGGHCWLDEQRIEAIGMAIKALQEESVSSDLEEAARKIATRHSHISGEIYYANDAWFFKKGAQWQKQQDKETIELAEDHAMLAGMEKMKQKMIEKAVPADVMFDYYDDKDKLNVSILATDILADEHGIKENDKVKIVIIK